MRKQLPCHLFILIRTVNACSDGCSIQINAAVGFSIDFMFNHVHFYAHVPIFPKSNSVSMTINGIILVAIHYFVRIWFVISSNKNIKKGKIEVGKTEFGFRQSAFYFSACEGCIHILHESSDYVCFPNWRWYFIKNSRKQFDQTNDQRIEIAFVCRGSTIFFSCRYSE